MSKQLTCTFKAKTKFGDVEVVGNRTGLVLDEYIKFQDKNGKLFSVSTKHVGMKHPISTKEALLNAVNMANSYFLGARELDLTSFSRIKRIVGQLQLDESLTKQLKEYRNKLKYGYDQIPGFRFSVRQAKITIPHSKYSITLTFSIKKSNNYFTYFTVTDGIRTINKVRYKRLTTGDDLISQFQDWCEYLVESDNSKIFSSSEKDVLQFFEKYKTSLTELISDLNSLTVKK